MSHRIEREVKTISVMINDYCRNHHNSEDNCLECSTLLDYARERLGKCPFHEGKTTCAKCRVHCFKPEMREGIRAVMRFAGPRIIFRHPVLALSHSIDGRRKKPLLGSTKGD